MKRAAVALLALVLCGRSAGAAECTLGAQRAVIPLRAVTNNLKNGWHVRISVGGGPLHSVQVDTGSRGLAVPRSTIGAAAVDTGKPGQIAYSSSGRILRGEYYMAKVTLEAGAERIETAPMPVLGVERVDCAPGYPRCSPRDRVTALGMAGVGFGRHGFGAGGAGLGDPLDANLFLRIAPVVSGAMHAGYVIAADRIELGLTAQNTAGFAFVPLAKSATTPGDWETTPGCFAFPAVTPPFAACGTVLVDTGLATMIFSLPAAQRPPALARAIPGGTAISVTAPGPNGPAFTYEATSGAPAGAGLPPVLARWSGSSRTTAFVNTGRYVIARTDYAFDAVCGRVGFRVRTP